MNTQLPRHVAITMDGNGRWAQERQLPRHAGHEEGVESVRSIVNACLEVGIPTLSIFAFSCENWQRPPEEVSALMALFVEALSLELPALTEKGVRLRFIGSRERLATEVVQAMEQAESIHPESERLQLIIALNYSGRWDLVNAAKQYLVHAEPGDDLDESRFASYLSLSDSPDPDLFIRTSGEQRISNFYLWQIAYTELYFSPVYWPDFREAEFKQALTWFALRERRFGKTSGQLQEGTDA